MTGRMRILIFLFIVCPRYAWVQTNMPRAYEIRSDSSFKQELDSTYWQVLEDKQGNWTITEVNSPPLSKKFHNTSTKSPFADTMVYTAWVRCRLKNTMNLTAKLSMQSGAGKTDFYFLKQNGSTSHFITGWQYPYSKRDGFKDRTAISFTLFSGEEVLIYMRKHNRIKFLVPTNFKIPLYNTEQLKDKMLDEYQLSYIQTSEVYLSFISGLLLLAAIFNFLIYMQTKDKVNLYFSLFLLCIFSVYNPVFTLLLPRESQVVTDAIVYIRFFFVVFLLFFIRHYFDLSNSYPRWDKLLLIATKIVTGVLFICMLLNPGAKHWLSVVWRVTSILYAVNTLITIIIVVGIAIKNRSKKGSIFLTAILPLLGYLILSLISSVLIFGADYNKTRYYIDMYVGGIVTIWAVVVFSKYLFKEYGQQQKQLLQIQMNKEREQAEFIAQQKLELERQVTERTEELKTSLEDLKSAQTQLIQSEKMASLGELTAGIAHEIQNPLNFVNNFSEVSSELLDEIKSELDKGDIEEAKSIADDVKQNLEKITHHGKRADAIVKSMLQHSRKSSRHKDPVDINGLVDEYLRLSYHGFRAKDKSFNAITETHFDPAVGKINVIGQDIGRVLLNLFNNAFYAVNKKMNSSNSEGESYEPTIQVTTTRTAEGVRIKVRDNGIGIPDKVLEKIYQPFFTTKPTGEGTGLGLSLSYDIITKGHGGELKVETEEGEGSEFIILLPTT